MAKLELRTPDVVARLILLNQLAYEAETKKRLPRVSYTYDNLLLITGFVSKIPERYIALLDEELRAFGFTIVEIDRTHYGVMRTDQFNQWPRVGLSNSLCRKHLTVEEMDKVLENML